MAPDGTVTEFPVTQSGGTTPVSGPELDGLTNGPDGNLWFVDHAANSVGRVNLDLPPIPIAYPGGPPLAWETSGKGVVVAPELTSVTRSGTLRKPTKLTFEMQPSRRLGDYETRLADLDDVELIALWRCSVIDRCRDR